MATSVIKVEGMTCGHCTSSVERAVGELTGVSSVTASLEAGEVTIEHDGSVPDAAFKAAIEDQGFDVV